MKFLKLGTIASAVLCAALLGTGAQANPVLVSSQSSVMAGDTFTVTLRESDVADAFDATLGYFANFFVAFDSSQLSLLQVTPNATLAASPDWFLDSNPVSQGLELVAFNVFADPTIVAFDIFELEFKALTQGPATVALAASGAYGNSTSFPETSATVQVDGQVTTPRDLPEPQALALLAITGLGAIAARRRSSTSR